MNFITAIFETPLALGSTVIIPILLFITSLIVKVKPMTALRTSFASGFCMVGISVLISRFGQMLVDLATSAVEQQGVANPVIDAGRKTALLISTASEIGIYIMPIAIVINIVLLLTRCTRTINLDIWSFWLFAFVGAMVESLTGKMSYGIIAASFAVVYTLVVADSSVKGIEKCCALRGVSFTNAVTASYAPIAGVLCWVVDKIPFKGRKDITFGWLQKKLGYFGDPVFIGTVYMAIFGLISGMGWVAAMQTAMQVGAYIFIVPKIMLLMADSLKPLAEGLEATSRDRLKLHSSLTIGLSSGVGLGNPAAMLLSVVLVPVAVWLSSVLPNNSFTPLADFSMLPYLLILIVAICRGGIWRSVLSGLIAIVVMIYSSSALSGLFTQAAIAADPTAFGSSGVISSMYGAGSPLTLVAASISKFGIAGMGALVLISLALALWNYNRLTGNVKIYVKKQKTYRTFAIDNLREEAERRRELRHNAVSKKREELRKAVETDRMIREEGMGVQEDEVEQLTIFTQTPQDVVDQTVATVATDIPDISFPEDTNDDAHEEMPETTQNDTTEEIPEAIPDESQAETIEDKPLPQN